MPRKFQGRNPPIPQRRWLSMPFMPSMASAVSFLIAFVLLAVGGCDDAATKVASAPPQPPESMQSILREDVHSLKRRGEIRTRARGGRGAEIVLLGDSITEGWHWDGSPVFRRAFADRPAVNLGVGGDRTENVLARLEEDLAGFEPRLVVLLIGTNNLGRDSASDVVGGIGAIVELLHALVPDAQVLLLALLPRGFEADSPERQAVRTVNRLLEREARGWSVTWLDVGDALIEPDGSLQVEVSRDGLHLTELGYARWWTAMQPTVDRLLQGSRASLRP